MNELLMTIKNAVALIESALVVLIAVGLPAIIGFLLLRDARVKHN